MWPVTVLILLSVTPTPTCCGPRNCVHLKAGGPAQRAAGSPRVGDSRNFHVESHANGCDALPMAQCCESWREHLQTQWLGTKTHADWRPRCTVVVHANRATYSAAIGRGGEQSFGSSWIDFQEGQVSRRQIDLLVDSQGKITALGHELTHVVIADAFPGQQPPAWANEGAALLADSTEKQRLHRRDLAQSFHLQTAYHCAELMQLTAYPRPERIPAFYAQSASVAAFLAEIGGAEKFIPFVKLASEKGYDHALREYYGMGGATDLHRRWHAQARESVIAGATSLPK